MKILNDLQTKATSLDPRPLRRDGLTDYSPTDKPWDEHRALSDEIAAIYGDSDEFQRRSARISECGSLLLFSTPIDPETGEIRFKLFEASFCRVPHCPVCQWRRSLMWKARFYSGMPEIMEQHSNARWVFLTLTAKNCPVWQLRDEIKHLNQSWQRLIKRKEFRLVDGWVRTTEITRGRDGSAHPHFHALLMVKPSWFTSGYVTQAEWTQIWRECIRADYDPIINIKAVKPRKGDDATGLDFLRGAVAETLKYSVKPSDMTDDPEWFREMARQTFRCRMIATGGKLKNILRVEEETNDDLILGDDEHEKVLEGVRLAFGWHRPEKRYRRRTKADKTT